MNVVYEPKGRARQLESLPGLLPTAGCALKVYMKIVISINNIVALCRGSFAAFGDPGLSIFILRCARAGHGGY